MIRRLIISAAAVTASVGAVVTTAVAREDGGDTPLIPAIADLVRKAFDRLAEGEPPAGLRERFPTFIVRDEPGRYRTPQIVPDPHLTHTMPQIDKPDPPTKLEIEIPRDLREFHKLPPERCLPKLKPPEKPEKGPQEKEDQ